MRLSQAIAIKIQFTITSVVHVAQCNFISIKFFASVNFIRNVKNVQLEQFFIVFHFLEIKNREKIFAIRKTIIFLGKNPVKSTWH